ncbi:MAG: hypothetical protein VYA55_21995 [Pseudomonadota bacterium]|nr:hypothetical protein [Pseudomonadota bacterium]
MRHFALVLALTFLQACSEDKSEMSIPNDVPGIWMDKGIQCFNEIADSTFDLSELPSNISEYISQYLDTEYGAPKYSVPIELSEIKYVGVYSACGKAIKLWVYPCGENNDCYVGIQPWKDTYYTSMVNPEFDLK